MSKFFYPDSATRTCSGAVVQPDSVSVLPGSLLAAGYEGNPTGWHPEDMWVQCFKLASSRLGEIVWSHRESTVVHRLKVDSSGRRIGSSPSHDENHPP